MNQVYGAPQVLTGIPVATGVVPVAPGTVVYPAAGLLPTKPEHSMAGWEWFLIILIIIIIVGIIVWMIWFYGVGFLAVLTGFFLYDYFSGQPKRLKPRKLDKSGKPISLKQVLWIGKPEREHYEDKGEPLPTEQNFYRQVETDDIYVIETKCDMLLGCFGPVGIEQMDAQPLKYPCPPHRNDWLRANEDKLVIATLCDRGEWK